MFYLGHPNSLGIESSNSQQHGNWLNIKANIYLFPLFKSWDFVKKTEKKYFLYDKLLFKNSKHCYIEQFSSFFNQSTLPCLLVLPKDTTIGVTLGTLFGGFILGVIVTAVVTTLMYRRLTLRTRKRYICGQFLFLPIKYSSYMYP